MSKISYVFIAGIAAAIGANAGVIQVGGATGLTSTYITNNGGTVGNGWALKGYAAQLFQNATITPTNGSPSLPVGGANATLSDGTNTFALVNSGTVGQNFWASPGATAAASLVIPVLGATSVTEVDILLNDYAGYAGSNPTIIFTFSGDTRSDVLPDVASGFGAIRSAVDCTSATNSGLTCPGVSTLPAGHTVSSNSGSTNTVSLLNSDLVTTKAIWTGTYSIAAGANGGAADYFYNSTTGTSGNVLLDELKFTFATSHQGQTLNSITIIPNQLDGGAGTTRLAVSAIDVITSTPEPSSVLLFVGGLGVLGFNRFRARKQ